MVAGPLQDELEALKQMPVGRQWPYLQSLILDLNAGRELLEVPNRSVFDLAQGLLAIGEIELLHRSFDYTDGEKRDAIQIGLMMSDDPRAEELLRVLAQQHKESIRLAPYRDGGIEYLLKIVEDTDRDPGERIRAVSELGRVAGPEVLDRLQLLTNDTAEPAAPTGVGLGIGQSKSVGAAVQRAVDHIRSKGERR